MLLHACRLLRCRIHDSRDLWSERSSLSQSFQQHQLSLIQTSHYMHTADLLLSVEVGPAGISALLRGWTGRQDAELRVQPLIWQSQAIRMSNVNTLRLLRRVAETCLLGSAPSKCFVSGSNMICLTLRDGTVSGESYARRDVAQAF